MADEQKQLQPVEAFLEDLVEVCKKHNAVIFPRRDSQRLYISVNIDVGDRVVWLDFTRVSGDGAERPA